MTYGANILVNPLEALALARRFETEQYAVGMAFSYAETVAASRALRAYAKLLSTPVCTEDDGSYDPVYPEQIARARWPEETVEHRAMRAAFCRGAALSSQSSDGGVEVRHAKTGNMPGSVPGEEMSSSATSLGRTTVQGAAIQPCAGVTTGPSELGASMVPSQDRGAQ